MQVGLQRCGQLLTQQVLDHVTENPRSDPLRRRSAPEHMRPGNDRGPLHESVEELLGIRVAHRPSQRSPEQVHEDHVTVGRLRHRVAFPPIVPVMADDIIADGEGPRLSRLRQGTVGVVAAAAN
ncbi:hypothetical protein SAV14893_082560 [Streptomyces avermitilis]|uniref:Uncharacterized protein n=1 Tax=Streptomyces avermitilis TaxID=33903 RepID=A0A4D4MAI1_STRAX|nr:hypothetical protein SAV14893_082560 [Streptomyces avermitilis]GDY70755.1 hypothetical protein SAV31267_002400 [Streptomyces avermitilis]